jgi:hypothetical protein
VIIPSRLRSLPLLVAVAAALGGAAAAWRYHVLGLTLSHYDARGHLVVARRVFDSITPGWQQIGAVWLPLPHLLNMVPVQVDALYRTGASGVAISVISFAVATAALAWIVRRLTGSTAGAIAAAAVFGLNPNVVYLQATPMTEPLLLGLLTLAVALLIEWTSSSRGAGLEGGTEAPRNKVTSPIVGAAFALACLTRYEAWPVTATALTAAVWTRWRQGREPLLPAIRRVLAIAYYPAAAIAGFMIFSRIVIGEWFVSSGFFVPDPELLGRPARAAVGILWATYRLSGPWIAGVSVAGLLGLLVVSLGNRRRSEGLLALSLGATAALPWLAFTEGHPFRIRYMVPLIALQAIGAGAAVGLVGWSGRLRAVAFAVVVLAAAIDLRPIELSAPMVMEAQWDLPNMAARAGVTGCLTAGYGGETIMASMGSLGHYMQETSQWGFRIRDFLHEGNGDIWTTALQHPKPYAGWILIEEKAEGGDMLAAIARERPSFLDGYSRVCEAAGLALYRRQNPILNVSR